MGTANPPTPREAAANISRIFLNATTIHPSGHHEFLWTGELPDTVELKSRLLQQLLEQHLGNPSAIDEYDTGAFTLLWRDTRRTLEVLFHPATHRSAATCQIGIVATSLHSTE